jgi:hypothetical protein
VLIPVEATLTLYQGATLRERFTVAATAPGDATLPDFTGVVVRAHLRPAASKRGAALLSLGSDVAPTASGSKLALVGTPGPASLVFDLVVSGEDSATLPYDAELGSDIEVVYPSGDVDRLARLTFTTDGEFTHG